MKRTIIFLLTLLLVMRTICVVGQSSQTSKPRTIVTTDGEIDDVDSFIRMLLYANEFRLEGLVYSSSMWHYKGDGKGTKMVSEMEMTKKMYGERTDLRWPGVTWMQDLIGAYEIIYPKLSTHATGFPTAKHLSSLIKVGNIDFEGEMKQTTEGSEFIKNKLLDQTTEPIYLQVWGGTNTIARALKSIEEQYKNTPQWAKIQDKVSKKVILFTIMDQDATYKNYVAVSWPAIKIYYNSHQFACLAYPWKQQVPVALHSFLEGKFMSNEIINNHGALTKMYYSYGDGQKQAGDGGHTHGDSTNLTNIQWGSFGKYDFISEGDSPAYLHLIDVGLNNLENPQFGGWGGRLIQSKTNLSRWEDGEATADFNPYSQKMDIVYGQTRWIDVLQQDFAARADWCVKSYKDANHAPKVLVKQGNKLTVKAGESIDLNAVTADSDGNKVLVRFWQYQEIGTSPEKVSIDSTGNRAKISVPKNAKVGHTIHIIVEAKDNGTPKLTRYQRVILTVK